MDRRGWREQADASVSSNALPALLGYGVLAPEKRPAFGNQGGTADNVLIRPWQKFSAGALFILGGNCYEAEQCGF